MTRRRPLLLALAIAAVVAPTADARSGYCSPTGDYCYSTKQAKGVRTLSFGTFSFREPVRTCVTAPNRKRDCRSFRLRESNGLYVFDVRWARHFPRRGRGTYRVSFRAVGTTLGPGISFRVR